LTIVYPLSSLTYAGDVLSTYYRRRHSDTAPSAHHRNGHSDAAPSTHHRSRHHYDSKAKQVDYDSKEEQATITGDDMNISYDGQKLKAYKDNNKIGKIYDEQTGNVSLLRDKGISVVADQQDAGDGTTVIKSTNMRLGEDKASFDSDGSVTINGELLELEDGDSTTLDDGSVITRSGDDYTVSTDEYNISIANDGTSQDLDCNTTADGVESDEVAPTGLWGDIFATESLDDANDQDDDGDGIIQDDEGDKYASESTFGSLLKSKPHKHKHHHSHGHSHDHYEDRIVNDFSWGARLFNKFSTDKENTEIASWYDY
jgi:hypothetical protein